MLSGSDARPVRGAPFSPVMGAQAAGTEEGLLHTLMIRCPQTGQSISTGFETDENSFSQTLTCSRTRAVPCACSTRMVVAGGVVIGSSSDKFASADRGLVGAAQKADEA